jgi:hypothetical protein
MEPAVFETCKCTLRYAQAGSTGEQNHMLRLSLSEDAIPRKLISPRKPNSKSEYSDRTRRSNTEATATAELRHPQCRQSVNEEGEKSSLWP